MKKKIGSLLLTLLCAVLVCTTVSGCDLLEGLKKDQKVVRVERVESDGQTITVYYEDGFEYETNYYAVLSYQSAFIPYFTSGNEKGEGEQTAESTKEEGKTSGGSSTAESTDDGYRTGQIIEIIGSNGDLHYSNSSHCFGVRVMGTNENPLGILLATASGVISFGGVGLEGAAIRITTTDKKSGLDLAGNGKSYELYDPYLRDCVIAYLKEATVCGSFADGAGGTVEVTSVLSGGFAELTNLEKVVLPSSIKTIYSGAFYRCTSLKTIQYDGTVEQWKAIKKSADWDKDSGSYTVYCTDGTVAKGE